jgi:hypothetical protein
MLCDTAAIGVAPPQRGGLCTQAIKDDAVADERGNGGRSIHKRLHTDGGVTWSSAAEFDGLCSFQQHA